MNSFQDNLNVLESIVLKLKRAQKLNFNRLKSTNRILVEKKKSYTEIG